MGRWVDRQPCVVNDFEALERRVNSQIDKNDFDQGYDDAVRNKVNKSTSEQYKEGYKLGIQLKGK